MGGLAAAAECRVPVKKKRKNSAVKLKAFRLPLGCLKIKKNIAVKLKASD